MGMGEPLANEGAVWGAVERIHGDLGLSARHITISTVGIVPGIRALAARPLPVNLAVSLHAANDTLRDELVPIKPPLSDRRAARCGTDYLAAKNRGSASNGVIDGVPTVRMTPSSLAALCRRLRPSAHVNLIPLNPTPGYPTKGTAPGRVTDFRDRLDALGPTRRSARTAAPRSMPPRPTRRRQPVHSDEPLNGGLRAGGGGGAGSGSSGTLGMPASSHHVVGVDREEDLRRPAVGDLGQGVEILDRDQVVRRVAVVDRPVTRPDGLRLALGGGDVAELLVPRRARARAIAAPSASRICCCLDRFARAGSPPRSPSARVMSPRGRPRRW